MARMSVRSAPDGDDGGGQDGAGGVARRLVVAGDDAPTLADLEPRRGPGAGVRAMNAAIQAARASSAARKRSPPDRYAASDTLPRGSIASASGTAGCASGK